MYHSTDLVHWRYIGPETAGKPTVVKTDTPTEEVNLITTAPGKTADRTIPLALLQQLQQHHQLMKQQELQRQLEKQQATSEGVPGLKELLQQDTIEKSVSQPAAQILQTGGTQIHQQDRLLNPTNVGDTLQPNGEQQVAYQDPEVVRQQKVVLEHEEKKRKWVLQKQRQRDMHKQQENNRAQLMKPKVVPVVVNPDQQRRLFTCQFCPYATTFGNRYRSHSNNHALGFDYMRRQSIRPVPSPSEEKRQEEEEGAKSQCPFCSFRAVGPTGVCRHIRVHFDFQRYLEMRGFEVKYERCWLDSDTIQVKSKGKRKAGAEKEDSEGVDSSSSEEVQTDKHFEPEVLIG